MSVNSKHIATFLLGAAAGFAAYKYMSMTEKEKEEFLDGLKEKANTMKDETEKAFEKTKDYFEELKTKGTEALKDKMGDVENIMKDLFGGKKEEKSV